MYNIILIPSIKNFIPSIAGIFLVSLSWYLIALLICNEAETGFLCGYIFPQFYGEVNVCQNRLALANEDHSDTRQLRKLPEFDKNYSWSCIMLCVYHAIWKPFNETICLKLPKNGKLLSSAVYHYGGMFLLMNKLKCSSY